MHKDDGLPLEATTAGPEMTMTEQAPDGISPEGISLDPVIQAHIGRELRALFDEIADEPVPDRFLVLLRSLEANQQDKP
jgi:hypothetical protein